MYELPEVSDMRKGLIRLSKDRIFLGIVCLLIGLCLLAGGAVAVGFKYFPAQTSSILSQLKMPDLSLGQPTTTSSSDLYQPAYDYENAVIAAAKNSSPAVVSIIISKDVPNYEQQLVNPFGDQDPFGSGITVPNGSSSLQEVGAGSGFFVSADGLILTNKHVVSDTKAEYTVYTNDGKKYQAKVIALDPVQDLALIKIQGASDGQTFPTLTLADSDGIQIGQTAIAIGNALGQFSNTVSVGVVSGMGRTISASDQGGGFSETLNGIIQTDAAINAGNSGGPLLNLKGQVIGIDTAMANGAQSIGFAIPINIAKKDIQQVQTTNKITYAFLGVRYLQVNDDVQTQYKLPVDYGAYVQADGQGDPAVEPNSPAAKAGLQAKDIILEVNGEQINNTDTLSTIIAKYNPGDTVTLQIMRDGKTISVSVALTTRTQ
jgi:serine protease Do